MKERCRDAHHCCYASPWPFLCMLPSHGPVPAQIWREGVGRSRAVVRAPLSWSRACSDLEGGRRPEYGGGAGEPRAGGAGGPQEVELGWETSPEGGGARVRGAVGDGRARMEGVGDGDGLASEATQGAATHGVAALRRRRRLLGGREAAALGWEGREVNGLAGID